MTANADFSESLFTLAQFVCAMLLVTWSLPRRGRFATRIAVVIAAALALTALSAWVGFVAQPQLMELPARSLTELLFFSAVLFLSAAALYALYDVDGWAAVALATAGYTIENLASSVIGLVALLLGRVGESEWTGEFFVAALLMTVGIYAIFYVLVARPLSRLATAGIENRAMVAGISALLLALIAFDIVNKALPSLGVALFDCLVLRAVHGICCVYLLCCEYELFYNVSLKTYIATLDRARADEAKSYAISQASASAINVKMHDIRHRLHDLDALGFVGPDELRDLMESLNIYDSSYVTGNDALDTVLTEKGLVCEQHDIALGCVADGGALDFMEPADVYSLFGDAIDNAIEAVQKLRSIDHRVIDVTVKRVGGMVVAHVENYYESNPAIDRRIRRGDKTVGRGYGMRHMRAIAERYGGSVTTSVEGDLFRLDAILPIPEGVPNVNVPGNGAEASVEDGARQAKGGA